MTVRENENSIGNSFRDELEWSAFRYATNEMSRDESDAFEQRLAEDQQAREALTRTVHITNAVVSQPVSVSADTTKSATTSRWASIATIVAIVAVCAAFAVGLKLLTVTPKSNDVVQSPKKPDDSTASRDRVIDAWLNFDPDELDDEIAPPVEDVALTVTPERISADEGEFDWVVAAVSPEAMENGSIEDHRKEQ